MSKSRKPVPAPLPEPETVDVRALKESLEAGEYDLVCVLGPTASGKTRYAVALARALGGEIISADSRQVYRGMDIGTGKDLDEYGEVPYHLIDIADAGEQYNVHRFQEDFCAAWADIRSRGRVPVLCGGTGLYISAVTAGYDFETKRPLSDGSRSGSDVCAANPALPGKVFFIGTLVGREERNRRIDARLDERLSSGMAEEMRALLASGVPAEVLISYGLEYKFVTQYVLGELEFGQMRTLLATAIHQFAKRQMTWFRGMERSGVKIHWVEV